MLLPGPSPAIHAALSSSSSPLSLLSCGGILPCLLWWQVPSEVFNHLSCKTPFNWNYPLADKLLEPYQEGDIVVRVFHAGRFSCGWLYFLFFLIVFLHLQFSPPVCLIFFFPQMGNLNSLFLSVPHFVSSFIFSSSHLNEAQSSIMSYIYGRYRWCSCVAL